jgi:hypothetical protein
MRTLTKIIVFSVFTLTSSLVTAKSHIVPDSIEKYCTKLQGKINSENVVGSFYDVKCVHKHDWKDIKFFSYAINIDENAVINYMTWLNIPLQHPECVQIVEFIKNISQFEFTQQVFEATTFKLTADNFDFYVPTDVIPSMDEVSLLQESLECSKIICQFLDKSECEKRSLSHKTYLEHIGN